MSQLNESMANQGTGRSPSLCVAWRSRGLQGMAGTSRMNREVHVRFCGGLVVRFLRSTRRPLPRRG
jgi:hypothetical protein